jgi:hypothetical protein
MRGIASGATGVQTSLGPADVKDRLEFPDDHDDWLEELAAIGPPPQPLLLPSRQAAIAELSWLGCRPDDAHAVAATLPSPERTPELWWLLERCYQQLASDLGGVDYLIRRWPSLPSSWGTPGRLFYAHVFLALARDVRRWHDRRGVRPHVSQATLADLGRSLDQYRSEHAQPGLDRQDWLSLHFRGALYELARLQFHRSRLVPGLVGAGPLFWYDRETAEAMGTGFQYGDAILGVHVPATGPLTPAACDDSLRLASDFFATTFADEHYPVAVCTSWLLDEQLADYLPATSNILAFQRRFRLLPGELEDDKGVLHSVFRRRTPLDVLEPRTSLERAVVRHLRAGGHWHIRTGWLAR